jgi:hypothetical protein
VDLSETVIYFDDGTLNLLGRFERVLSREQAVLEASQASFLKPGENLARRTLRLSEYGGFQGDRGKLIKAIVKSGVERGP